MCVPAPVAGCPNAEGQTDAGTITEQPHREGVLYFPPTRALT